MWLISAEELALRALIEEAKERLAEEGVEMTSGSSKTLFFREDRKFLFRPEVDGIEESVVGARLGITQLRFEKWFTPFDNAASEVQQYCADL